MSYKIKGKDNFFIIVITVLVVSFIINMYQALVIKEYKNEFRYQNYNRIEEIRYRNESILSTLESCITANSINNQELLALYKNYTEIVDSEMELWESYLDNHTNMFIKHNNKKVSISGKDKNEMFWHIEEFIYGYLQNNMNEDTSTIELKGQVLTDFQALKNLSLDLNNYFNDFYEKNCSNLSEEKKKEKIIKESYWVNLLEGIQEVSNKYIDYSFRYK